MRWLALLLIFIAQKISAQVLDNFPQINSGGTVYAVVEDSVNNIIYVAGDFTSVGGQSKKNIAAINMFGNAVVNSFNPVNSMSGNIYCMALYGNWLYIGGDYTQINGNASLTYLQRINLTTGTIDQTWNIGPNNNVYDLVVHGNSLYAAGTGNIIYHPLTAETREGIAKIDASTGQLLSFDPTGNPSNGLAFGNFDVRKILIDQNQLYAFGKGFSWTADGIIAFDLNTSLVIAGFTPSFTYDACIDACIIENEIYLVNSRFWPSAYELIRINKSNGTYLGGIPGMPSGVKTISSYANQLILAGNFSAPAANTSAYLAIWNHSTQSFINWLPNPNCGFGDIASVHIHRNRLYTSSNCLNTISANARAGLARFCLAPHPSGSITGSDLTLCPNQNGLPFTINAVPYANYYVWNYSGIGVTISGSGTSIFLNANNAPTSGTLSVTPYSACLAGTPSNINITIDPAPQASAGNDSSLTCSRTEVILQGQSTTPNTSFYWKLPDLSIQNGSTININASGIYSLFVTDNNNGCVSKDDCTIYLDTAKPIVLLPSGPFELNCRDTTLLLFGNTTTQNTMLHWRKSTGEFFPDPFLCATPGTYYLSGTNNINGCKDSSALSVFQNITVPDIYFVCHPIASIVLDTLTCRKDSVLVAIGSFTQNVEFSFELPDQSILTTDSVFISAAGLYTAMVKNTNNGCKNELPFVIHQDITPPSWNINDTLMMDCISDSVFVSATTNQWNEIGFVTSAGDSLSNPAYTDTIGWIRLWAINQINGCEENDSILIGRSTSFPAFLGNDTVVCVDGELCLSPQLMETHGDELFSWSNGGQNSMQCFTIQNDTSIFVRVNSIGCSGSDTIYIQIPEQPTATSSGIPSCLGGIAGSIQVQAVNGNGPFNYYCINTTTHDSTGNFTFTDTGIYSFILSDIYGCRYFHTDTLFEQENLPDVNFMAHSYFGTLDTLVLIANSSLQADSLKWQITPEPNIVWQNDTSLAIVINQEDSLLVEMSSFYNGCEVEFLRWLIPGNYLVYNIATTPEITIWPNPNNGEFSVSYLGEFPLDLNYQIRKLNGEIVVQQNINQAQQFSRTENLDNSYEQVYVLLITSEFFVLRKSILVVRP